MNDCLVTALRMPSTAIKVSSSLATEARTAATDADRSLTGQIEHWARLGKAMEPLFTAPTIAALKKSGGDLSAIEDEKERTRVLEVMEEFHRTPREIVRRQLGLVDKPIIEPDPGKPDRFIRIHPDGSRERGVIQGRKFVAE